MEKSTSDKLLMGYDYRSSPRDSDTLDKKISHNLGSESKLGCLADNISPSRIGIKVGLSLIIYKRN